MTNVESRRNARLSTAGRHALCGSATPNADWHRPRIAFLNRSYWPDTEATGQLLDDLSTHLADEFEVTVVAGQPNTCVHPGLFRARGLEVRHGVRIERLNHTRFRKQSLIGRLFNLASFTSKVYCWGRRSSRFDVIISETDPFFLPLVAAPMAKRMRAKYIAYVQDIYPDIGIALRIQPESMATRTLRERLRRAYARADRIVVLDEDMRARLIDWGLPPEKFVVIPNWVDTHRIRPVLANNSFRARYGLENRFIVMHSGNMGLTQRLELLVQAASDPAWPTGALLLLVGNGVRAGELQSQINRLCLHDRVRMLLFQPLECLSDSLSAADLQVVSMDGALRGCMFPSKLPGVFAAGRATLAIGPIGGVVEKLMREHQLGYTALPNSPSDFIRAVRHAMEHADELCKFGSNARNLAVRAFDKVISCTAFQQLLHDLLAPQQSMVCGDGAMSIQRDIQSTVPVQSSVIVPQLVATEEPQADV